ncbi:hypothetical protein PVAP13_3KG126971 [Panicum virgatum]|uniref:Uncharacterized protein n=1 Tax=Panicum virgatum TaxID=38727 RepID=A0A8T0UTB4_PANVG|nr:hypothetical protein PVAP13_3KG126971 [Panicum virgatum]
MLARATAVSPPSSLGARRVVSATPPPGSPEPTTAEREHVNPASAPRRTTTGRPARSRSMPGRASLPAPCRAKTETDTDRDTARHGTVGTVLGGRRGSTKGWRPKRD